MEQIAQYQIKELLGEGSFAWVYRAFDQKFERYVALKLLKPIWLSDPQAVARFEQEAKTMAGLRHPNIIDVYDVGEVAGQIYLAQLLVQGESLATRLARGPLKWDEILNILQSIGSALDYAHGQGIIHRDIKPSNILLGSDNHVYLGDFGLIRAVEGSTNLSSSVSMIGTTHYMAPEIWDGKRATPATDVYALTCVAFEMITGEVLFEGSSMAAVTKQHIVGPQFPTEWPTGVPAGVTEVLQQGLTEDPVERMSSGGELATALAVLSAPAQPITPGLDVTESTHDVVGTTQVAGGSLPQRWISIGTVAILVAIVIGGIAFFTWGSGGGGEIDIQGTVAAELTVAAIKLAKTQAAKVANTPTPAAKATPTSPPTPVLPTPTAEPTETEQDFSEQRVQIQNRGKILVGIRHNDLYPMAFWQGTDYSGFEIELAKGIVKRLFGEQMVIEWIPLTASERFEAVDKGQVDFLIRLTTHTIARERLVLFTSNYFLDGMRLSVRQGEGIDGIEDLAGQTIVTVNVETASGLTRESIVRQAAAASGVEVNVIVEEDPYAALDEGRADAFASDWTGFGLYTSNYRAYQTVGGLLSKEPLAIAVSLNNSDFRDELDQTLLMMIEAGTWQAIYNRWFPTPPPWTVQEMLAEPPVK